MAKVLRMTADGQAKQVEVDDAELGISSAPIPEDVATGSEKRKFFDRFGDVDEVVVHEVELEVLGQMETFFIKEHATGELAKIDAKRYRIGKDGQIVRNPEAESINGMKWELYASVVENKGTKEIPDWQPFFTLEELDERLRGKNPKANEFLDMLLGEIWRINPALNPLKKIQAEKIVSEL